MGLSRCGSTRSRRVWSFHKAASPASPLPPFSALLCLHLFLLPPILPQSPKGFPSYNRHFKVKTQQNKKQEKKTKAMNNVDDKYGSPIHVSLPALWQIQIEYEAKSRTFGFSIPSSSGDFFLPGDDARKKER